jgi:hypothetical protein
MNPSIVQTGGGGLSKVHGYELYDRANGHVIAESTNTFDLEAIGSIYRARLGKETAIRPAGEGNKEIII